MENPTDGKSYPTTQHELTSFMKYLKSITECPKPTEQYE